MGFEAKKVAIDAKIGEIRLQLAGRRSEPATSSEIRKPRKKRSAAVRRKMALAQKARWAKIKQGSAPQPAHPATKKPKRTMSTAGRRALIAATKKRRAAGTAAKKHA